MSCSNCFNNCGTVSSDKCTKYTGASIPSLNISTGDTLLSVEENLISFLLTTLNGTGIYPEISPTIICPLVSAYLPSNPNLKDIVTTLIKVACDLQEQLTAVITELNTIDASYTTDCLIGVSNTSKTHDVLQAVINSLCGLSESVDELSVNINTHYVKISDLDTLIQAYLDSISTSSLMKNRMVPYAAIEYYGDLTGKFDVSGAGLGDWTEIYICNGDNGTPDKRGRIPIGVTEGIGLLGFNADVDPAITGNPAYTLSDTQGSNTITLDETMIPAHTHTADSVVTDPTHTHFEFNTDLTSGVVVTNTLYSNRAVASSSTSTNYEINGSATEASLGLTSPSETGITVATTNANTGGGLSHSNIPPVLACYYLMYIPN